MFHYVYEITNNINGRKYIGKHSTNDMNDGYMGSGIAIKQAIKKYGSKNFSKKIIKSFETSEEAFKFEKEIIEQLDCVNNYKYYNMSDGGIGGVGTLSGKTELEKVEIYNRMKNTLKGKMAGEKNPMYGKVSAMKGKKHTKEAREKMSKALKGKPFSKEHRKNISKSRIGMKLSEETKKKISENHRNVSGKNNPMYGITGENHHSARKIICLTTGEIFNCIKTAAIETKSDRVNISHCCKGKRKTTGNKKWMYLEDYNYCIENSIDDFELYKKDKYNK